MSKIMSREELLQLFTELILNAKKDYDRFDESDGESRRKFMNSIISAGTQYHTIQAREELVNLKELLDEIQKWRNNK